MGCLVEARPHATIAWYKNNTIVTATTDSCTRFGTVPFTSLVTFIYQTDRILKLQCVYFFFFPSAPYVVALYIFNLFTYRRNVEIKSSVLSPGFEVLVLRFTTKPTEDDYAFYHCRANNSVGVSRAFIMFHDGSGENGDFFFRFFAN